MLFPIVFEGEFSFLKQLDDIFWGMAVLELRCGGMFDEVYSSVLVVIV